MTRPHVTPRLDIDDSDVPGAMEHTLSRDVSGLGRVEFETAPAGWTTAAGEARERDWRAYFFTPYPLGCKLCDETGRIDGVRANTTKSCPTCKGTGSARRKRLPSVSSVLDAICPKPGLAPWSEERGIEGAVEAIRRGDIDLDDPESTANAVRIVRSKRLGADRARDHAAERGLNVHDCLRVFLETGSPPNPDDHPLGHRGYLKALEKWLLHRKDMTPIAVEQLVVHPDEGYAGRLDMRAEMDGALYTMDAKTNEYGAIWTAAHVQTALYEHAARACGDPPAEHRLVVVFAADGTYREQHADHGPELLQAALAWYRAVKPVDGMCIAANRIERDARKLAA